MYGDIKITDSPLCNVACRPSVTVNGEKIEQVDEFLGSLIRHDGRCHSRDIKQRIGISMIIAGQLLKYS